MKTVTVGLFAATLFAASAQAANIYGSFASDSPDLYPWGNVASVQATGLQQMSQDTGRWPGAGDDSGMLVSDSSTAMGVRGVDVYGAFRSQEVGTGDF